MDSAQIMKSVNGHVEFVEECQCPAGYTGLSCEVSVKYVLINTIKCMKSIYFIIYIIFNIYFLNVCYELWFLSQFLFTSLILLL